MGADLIVFGPGSLYTSILPTILVQAIRDAVLACSAKKVYICNLTTQKGETVEYSASEHVKALYDHAGAEFIDTVLVNDADFNALVEGTVHEGKLKQVENDLEALHKLVPEVVLKEIAVIIDGNIRHNSGVVAKWLVEYMKNEKNQT